MSSSVMFIQAFLIFNSPFVCHSYSYMLDNIQYFILFVYFSGMYYDATYCNLDYRLKENHIYYSLYNFFCSIVSYTRNRIVLLVFRSPFNSCICYIGIWGSQRDKIFAVINFSFIPCRILYYVNRYVFVLIINGTTNI